MKNEQMPRQAFRSGAVAAMLLGEGDADHGGFTR